MCRPTPAEDAGTCKTRSVAALALLTVLLCCPQRSRSERPFRRLNSVEHSIRATAEVLRDDRKAWRREQIAKLFSGITAETAITWSLVGGHALAWNAAQAFIARPVSHLAQRLCVPAHWATKGEALRETLSHGHSKTNGQATDGQATNGQATNGHRVTDGQAADRRNAHSEQDYFPLLVADFLQKGRGVLSRQRHGWELDIIRSALGQATDDLAAVQDPKTLSELVDGMFRLGRSFRMNFTVSAIGEEVRIDTCRRKFEHAALRRVRAIYRDLGSLSRAVAQDRRKVTGAVEKITASHQANVYLQAETLAREVDRLDLIAAIRRIQFERPHATGREVIRHLYNRAEEAIAEDRRVLGDLDVDLCLRTGSR